MEINKTMDNVILKMCIEGRIDTTTSPVLVREIEAVSEDVKELILIKELL